MCPDRKSCIMEKIPVCQTHLFERICEREAERRKAAERQAAGLKDRQDEAVKKRKTGLLANMIDGQNKRECG